MIISASRRTDIPSFYAEWFMNRIKEGFVYVRNPMNFNGVSMVSLKPEDVEFIVFWTKDARGLLDRIEGLNDYKYYFQHTITSYNNEVETAVDKKENIIERFKMLSDKIGSEKVIWRYDPIMIFDDIDKSYHLKYFEHIARKLSGYTNKCVVSFVDVYRKNVNKLRGIGSKELSYGEMHEIICELKQISDSYGLLLETCAEKNSFADIGVNSGKCIDDELISKICTLSASVGKDKVQREECGCVASVDIGAYNTCPNNCVYCYANFSEKVLKENRANHDVNSPLLFGELRDSDKVTEREVKLIFKNQRNLFE